MLRVAFFKCPTSFGFKIAQEFASSLLDKPEEKEIPAPMLALVATAVTVYALRSVSARTDTITTRTAACGHRRLQAWVYTSPRIQH